MYQSFETLENYKNKFFNNDVFFAMSHGVHRGVLKKGKFDQRIIPYHIEVDYYIELHCKFPKWKDFIETLAHEMVHLYQMTWMKDPYSNHNANFFAWKNKFESAGLKLSRC